jgi:valyl-tRNA synthetase
LYHVFSTIIKLIAPYLPHITEEIYQAYFKEEEIPSIHRTAYPTPFPTVPRTSYGEGGSDPAVLRGKQGDFQTSIHDFQTAMTTTLEIVDQVRRYKSESQISMGSELSKLIISANPEQKKAIQLFEDDVKGITKAKEIEWKEGTLGAECRV